MFHSHKVYCDTKCSDNHIWYVSDDSRHSTNSFFEIAKDAVAFVVLVVGAYCSLSLAAIVDALFVVGGQ